MKVKYTILLMCIGLIMARPQDMPRFGKNRLLYLPSAEHGTISFGGGYSPYYIDGDSTNITMSGHLAVGILDWFSVHAWYPHFSDTRLGELKAGPGDAIVSASIDWAFPIVRSLRGAAFVQTSVPTGYTEEHPQFPSYTSSGNDLCYGGAIGYTEKDIFELTANFSVSTNESGSDVYYNPGAGFCVHLPWRMEAGVEYHTDFTSNPSHEINLRFAKSFYFTKTFFAFKKNFRDPDESFGYQAGIEFQFPMFNVYKTTPKNVYFKDMTDWNNYPGMDSVWLSLEEANQRVLVDSDSFVTFELRLADFTSQHEEKKIVPLLVEKDCLVTKYALNIRSVNQAGEAIAEWNIFGEDISDSEIRFAHDDRKWDMMFTSRVELEKIKAKAMKNLYKELMKEMRRYNKGKY